MTKDEALRLALGAFENLGNHHHDCPQWPTYTEPEKYPKCTCGYDQAITAIKAALEAKGEPVANSSAWFALVMNAAAELEDASHCLRDEDAKQVAIRGAKYYREQAHTLYTTPPQRTWVGLTDEQYLEACKMAEGGNYMVAFQRIQQWLKESNT